jgi:hypothetical protein
MGICVCVYRAKRGFVNLLHKSPNIILQNPRVDFHELLFTFRCISCNFILVFGCFHLGGSKASLSLTVYVQDALFF